MKRADRDRTEATPAAAAAVRPAEGPDGSPPPERADLLLVDDRTDRLAALEAALEGLGPGVDLVRAHSGREALHQLLRRDFAVILLDVHMPVMDGFETAALIRERRRTRHTPIIFITAFGPNEAQVTRGYSLGAVDYVFVPVVPEVLRAKVTVFIDLHRKTAQVRRQAEWLRDEAQRRAARLETRLRGVLDRLEVGVFRATPEGEVLEANPALLKLLGRPAIAPASAPGLAELFPGLDPAAAAADPSCRARDLRVPGPDGAERWLTVTMARVEEGDGTAFLDGIVEDVSARRGAEEALREAHAALEGKAKELARSNTDLQRFASVVSHDLQEPLRMVATFTDLLARRAGDRLDGEARQYLRYAREAAGRMQGMIHGLLDFCIVETTPGRRRATDAGKVLDRVLADLRMAIEEAGAVVSRDPMPTVVADEVQLGHVLQNLVANAVKFRREETRPRIHVGAERRGEAWLLSVRDNGIGIDPAAAEGLFMIFRRLPGSERFPGNGMGLALAKRIVERHGCRIWMEPAPGGGSVFLFTLPASAETAPGKDAAVRQERKERRP